MYNVRTQPATTLRSRNGTHHLEGQTHQKALSSKKAITHPGDRPQSGTLRGVWGQKSDGQSPHSPNTVKPLLKDSQPPT